MMHETGTPEHPDLLMWEKATLVSMQLNTLLCIVYKRSQYETPMTIARRPKSTLRIHFQVDGRRQRTSQACPTRRFKERMTFPNDLQYDPSPKNNSDHTRSSNPQAPTQRPRASRSRVARS